MEASVWVSLLMGTFSLASTAWWSPSDQRLPVLEPAGELVDDDDLALFDHIVDVLLEEVVGLEGLVEVVQERGVLDVVEVVDVRAFFGFRGYPLR